MALIAVPVRETERIRIHSLVSFDFTQNKGRKYERSGAIIYLRGPEPVHIVILKPAACADPEDIQPLWSSGQDSRDDLAGPGSNPCGGKI
jgi:hypothetical protein